MRRGEDVGVLLRRRASLLAGARPDEDRSSDAVPMLLVEVGDGQRYAVEARHVRQVQRNAGLRRVPSGAGAVLGVVRARGGVVPVADLAAVLGVGSADPARPLVVVLEGAGSPLGLLVDSSDLAGWRADEVRVPAGAGERDGAARPAGVGPGGAVVLEVEALVGDPRLSRLPDHRAGH